MDARISFTTSDHVHKLTAETDGSIWCNRSEVGEYEQFTVVTVDANGTPLPPGEYALLAYTTNRYLSALDELTCKQRGIPPNSVQATAQYVDLWERWRVASHLAGLSFQSVFTGKYLSPQMDGTGGVLCNGPEAGPWEEIIPSDFAPFDMQNSGQGGIGTGNLLQGPVVIAGRSFGDRGGPRLLHGVSDFGALVKFHENPDQARRELDAIAQAGQLYIRVLFRLNGWLWGGGDGYPSSGLTVDPIRDPWFDEALRGYLSACHERGLRVNLTSGDFYNWTSAQAAESFARVGDIAASVSPEVVWLLAIANEMRGIWPGGESDENIAQACGLLDDFHRRYPGALLAISDPGSQDKAGMERLSAAPANVALIHDVRWSANDALRRCFNTAYENFPGKPVVQDEPTGPNGNVPQPFGQNVYQPIDDVDDLLAIYTMQVLTGQASTYFADPALVSREPIDSSWGVRELPAAWREMGIPPTIGQGTLKPGHHDDAPLQVIDSNAERADSMVDGGYSLGVISGGDGGWQVRAGVNGTCTAWTGAGVVYEGPVSRGQVIPIKGPTPTVVRIVAALLLAVGLSGCGVREAHAVNVYRQTLDLFCLAGDLPAADCEAHRRALLAVLRHEAECTPEAQAPPVVERVRRIMGLAKGRR